MVMLLRCRDCDCGVDSGLYPPLASGIVNRKERKGSPDVKAKGGGSGREASYWVRSSSCMDHMNDQWYFFLPLFLPSFFSSFLPVEKCLCAQTREEKGRVYYFPQMCGGTVQASIDC